METKLQETIRAAKTGGDPTQLLKLAQALEQSGAFQTGERPEYQISLPWGPMKIKLYKKNCISIVCYPTQLPWEIAEVQDEELSHEHEFCFENLIDAGGISLSRLFPPEQDKGWVPFRYSDHKDSFLGTLFPRFRGDLESIRDHILNLDIYIRDWLEKHPQEMLQAERDWKLFEIESAYHAYLTALQHLKPMERTIRSAVEEWLKLL